MKANQKHEGILREMNETTFKTMFWINQAKIYTKSEDLSVVNYIGLHF